MVNPVTHQVPDEAVIWNIYSFLPLLDQWPIAAVDSGTKDSTFCRREDINGSPGPAYSGLTGLAIIHIRPCFTGEPTEHWRSSSNIDRCIETSRIAPDSPKQDPRRDGTWRQPKLRG